MPSLSPLPLTLALPTRCLPSIALPCSAPPQMSLLRGLDYSYQGLGLGASPSTNDPRYYSTVGWGAGRRNRRDTRVPTQSVFSNRMRNFARLSNRVQWIWRCGASGNVDAQLGPNPGADTSARTSTSARSIRPKFTMGFEPVAPGGLRHGSAKVRLIVCSYCCSVSSDPNPAAPAALRMLLAIGPRGSRKTPRSYCWRTIPLSPTSSRIGA